MFGQLTDRVVLALSEKLDTDRPDCVTRNSKVSYANGDHYEGQVHNSKEKTRHGRGVYYYADGKGRYEGEFVDDEKHGRGTFFFPDGDVYCGAWCGNRQHGHGVSVHWSPQQGVWIYEGEFRHGQRHGSGSLVVRDRGALCGMWADGRLSRGVELRSGTACVGSGGGSVFVAVVGCRAGVEPERRQKEEGTEEEVPKAINASQRAELGPSPREWQAAEVRLWLQGLGLREIPERAPLSMNGSQLLSVTDLEEQVVSQCQADAGMSDLAQSWRMTLRAAHGALFSAVASSQAQLKHWDEIQSALPSLRKRFIPSSEVAAPGTEQTGGAGRAVQSGEWRGMRVELFPLPLRLAAAHGASGGSQLPFAEARSWARDLEVLATLRHPNLRPLLGVTLGAPGPDAAGSPAGSAAAVTLVYEAARSGSLLFEWIHASLPDGSKRPLETKSQLRICIGVCEALATLAARGLALAALCSVNVELLQAGGGLVPRLTRTGSSWWRWGWRSALQVREPGQARRRALSVEEVVRRYATCPVNWQAPEVLRGQEPSQASDIYSFGLVVWEMLYRSIPFGDFSIAQIVGAVGYGRRSLSSPASPGASTVTSYLHEVVSRCTQWNAALRPSAQVLLDSLQDVARGHERKHSGWGMLGKLGKETEALFTSGLGGGGGGPRSQAGGGRAAAAAAAAAAEAGGGEGRRMVRLASGEWVRVHADLLEQYPGDEEKWRTLMAFRARLPSSGEF